MSRGPTRAVVSSLTAGRARAWATSRSSDVKSRLMNGAVGEAAQLTATSELIDRGSLRGSATRRSSVPGTPRTPGGTDGRAGPYRDG